MPSRVEPLVLLAGSNCSSRLWAGLRLHSLLTPEIGEPTVTAQVDRLLEELPPRFSLGGLSLGAVLAMALTRTAPERVTRLCLLSTNARAPSTSQLLGWRRQRDRLAGGAAARELQRSQLPDLLSPQVLRGHSELVGQVLAMADDVGAARLDRQLRLQATRVDERDGLAAIRCPTLVIAARDDVLCPLERHLEIADLVPGAELVVLDHCAHLSPLEQPSEINAALQVWLNRKERVS